MHSDPFCPSENPQPGIRHALEREAWRRHPELARRLERRHARRSGERRSLRWQDRVLLVLGIVLLAAVLLRIETASAQPDGTPFGLELHGEQGVETRLAVDTRIQVEITGLSARVLVVQDFLNDGDGWAEAVYRFPLPDGAAVDRLFVRVGERIIEGEIREREDARRVYRQARAEGRTASLVAQERVNQFQTRLANIAPGEDIQVMIGFLAQVAFDDGVFSLRLPTTFNQRFGGERGPDTEHAPVPQPVFASLGARQGGHRLEIEVELLTALEMASVESRYHDVVIQPSLDGYFIHLADGQARSDRDFELAWYPAPHDAPRTSLLTWDRGDAVYAQLMLVAPAEEALLEQPRELIFIIDTSGSMQGASLGQAKAALLQGLAGLRPQDRFNLVEFNSTTTTLFPAPVPAAGRELGIARAAIHRLAADGGTVMGPALEAALTMPASPGLVRQVVFITDGSVGNEQELLWQIGEQLGEARLFMVGIGSAPHSWFLRKAAEIGRGSHTHVGRLDEVEARINALWSRIRVPAISDLCIDWGVEAEYYPEIIPDLYAGAPLWVTARLPATPGPVRLCGELNGQPWEHFIGEPARPGNATLATLWAQRKVEALQDSVVFGADPARMRTEVTRVALDYELLTPHTSLVAVDRTPVRLPGEALASGQIPSLLPAGSAAGSAAFPATATGWRAQLALSLLVLLLSGWMFFSPGSRWPGAASRVH